MDHLSQHITPIIRKKLTTLTEDAGTNPSSRDIQDNMLKLKSLFNEKLPQSKVWLSTPTLGSNNGKAALTVSQLVRYFLDLNIDVNR